MKNLDDYVVETIIDNSFHTQTIEDVYENIFNRMYNINECIINEGFFSKVANLLKNAGNKVENFDKTLEDKRNKLSDAAKNAIANAKQTAGNDWNSIKDTFSNVVALIDGGLQDAKGAITDAVKKAGIKADEIEIKLAEIYTNGIARKKETIINTLADVKKIPAVNALMIGAIMCNKAGFNSSQIIDILDAAGVK